ncbi:hypothetical protein CONLIGDRAFT_668344 [Coniochaeta ligniaria NRRL 30616]|uniref:C2H2-type domain-containing protein n=1 Tax=Coniochaeta ligniaria NRRL 30616 TaxID=1408157 RepID=A0A1J7JH66_9PEZI|nr:hypothetical protein CONLIGDRAFT_668344 [Coniochaeta ligniaria NRRL 30616]
MSTDREEQGTRRMMPDHKELVVPASIDTAKAKYLSVQSDQEPKSAASSIRSGVTSASPLSSTYSCPEEPYMGPHGWILPSQFRHRSASRSSAASATSCRTDETPLTPMSNPDDALALDLSQLDVKLEHPQPMFPMPFRPKHKNNRESWDSALGSDFSGRYRRHAPSASLSGTSDYSSIRSLSLDERGPAPVARSIEDVEPTKSHDVPVVKETVTPVAERRYLSSEESDSDETVSDETVSNETIPPKDASRRVLNYTLDVVFGLAIDNVTQVPSTCRSVVDNFISDMTWAVDQESAQKQVPRYDCAADLSRLPTNASTSSSATSSSQRSSTRSDKGKRKSRDSGDDDQDGDDECDDEPSKRRESGPSKRPKLDPVRLSCPFRKKNPLRFNVRDHRLCALTVFTDTAELRRHIQDLHKRPALPYQCLRCQSQFSTQDEFGDHLRSAERCPLIETPLGSNDPEDGIDESIVKILRSKKGRVSDPVEVQWQKIWELLFPGTPVQPYDYCAVMEHFELYEKYRSSLPHLRTSLSRIGLGERGLDSLSNILNNHFIGLFEQCNEEGRQKDYRNRQPKPQQSQLRPKRRSFRERVENKAHRDSGVDVGMEDEAADEESLAKPDGTEENTPTFGTEAGDMLVGQLQPSDEHVDYSGLNNFNDMNPAVFVDHYRDMTFPADTDITGLDGGYNPAYTTQPSANTEFRTKVGVSNGALPEHSFGYHCSQDNPNQLEGEWGLGSTGLGFGEPMTDLNAWVYEQHGQPR